MDAVGRADDHAQRAALHGAGWRRRFGAARLDGPNLQHLQTHVVAAPEHQPALDGDELADHGSAHDRVVHHGSIRNLRAGR
ncbi:MAG TPA: hypothetical protein VFT31_15000 [Kribbella sp.]|nr:hypothetical protein [Kribbella sp.]